MPRKLEQNGLAEGAISRTVRTVSIGIQATGIDGRFRPNKS